jgi:hypothetical protein
MKILVTEASRKHIYKYTLELKHTYCVLRVIQYPFIYYMFKSDGYNISKSAGFLQNLITFKL